MDILRLPPPPRDHRIPYGPHPAQFGDLRLPLGRGPHPVVVVLHGGFWRHLYDLEHLGHLAAALTREGFATWNLEYRRVGDPGGGFPGTFLDASAGLDFVRQLGREYPLDDRRVVVVGFSTGGHLALWLGGRHRLPPGGPIASRDPLLVRGVVSLAGLSDLRECSQRRLGDGAVDALMGGTPDELGQRYAEGSPSEMLPLGVRQILVHGALDDLVPADLSASYCKAAAERGDPVEGVLVPGAGHFDLIDPRSHAWPAVLRAVRGLFDEKT